MPLAKILAVICVAGCTAWTAGCSDDQTVIPGPIAPQIDAFVDALNDTERRIRAALAVMELKAHHT